MQRTFQRSKFSFSVIDQTEIPNLFLSCTADMSFQSVAYEVWDRHGEDRNKLDTVGEWDSVHTGLQDVGRFRPGNLKVKSLTVSLVTQ